jgi:hypothetical protein
MGARGAESVLTSLLPGFRDLRAPLSAGFLWLLVIWLAIEPGLPDEDDATGLVASLLVLKDAASPLGLAAAATFAAYVLGSVAEAVAGPLAWLATLPITPWLTDEYKPPRRLGSRSYSAAADDLTEKARSGLWDLCGRVSSEAARTLRRSDVRGLTNDVAGIDFNPEGDSVFNEAQKELAQMRTRLLADEPELFSMVDRLYAEAEFRIAIAPPLVGLAIVIVFRGPWWLGVPIVITAGLLRIQGAQRYRASNEALVEAARIGKVTPPVVDRLRAALDEETLREQAEWWRAYSERQQRELEEKFPQAARLREGADHSPDLDE